MLSAAFCFAAGQAGNFPLELHTLKESSNALFRHNNGIARHPAD